MELDLSDNAFGPDGVRGFEALLKSPACYTLQELKLNNCGMGIGGGKVRIISSSGMKLEAIFGVCQLLCLRQLQLHQVLQVWSSQVLYMETSMNSLSQY